MVIYRHQEDYKNPYWTFQHTERGNQGLQSGSPSPVVSGSEYVRSVEDTFGQQGPQWQQQPAPLRSHHATRMANRSGAQRPNGAQQGKICQFKLVLLGESAVGKSSLVLRFVKGQFHEYQESTIGGEGITFAALLQRVTL